MQTITVSFWDVYVQETMYVLEMPAVPRIGDFVSFEEEQYLVKGVEWVFDRDRDSAFQEVIVMVDKQR
jgi:hypothetical protein